MKKRQKIDIDPLKIDLEDEATLALFRAGNTMGIFQFENPQMRRFLRNLAPSKFDDIVDATSISVPVHHSLFHNLLPDAMEKKLFQLSMILSVKS